MKTIPLPGRLALLCSAVLGLSLASAIAQTSLDFTPFETEGVSNPGDLDFIDINGLVIATPDGVRIGIFNDSNPGSGWITESRPAITRIFFEDGAGVLSNDPGIESVSAGVSFVRNDGANLPGGNNIGFTVESAFTATAPPSMNGVDPGEWIYFLFAGSNYDSVLAGLTDGSVRIAMHVQEIGKKGEDSAAFVNVAIPEPASALLGALGLLGLLRRRR